METDNPFTPEISEDHCSKREVEHKERDLGCLLESFRLPMNLSPGLYSKLSGCCKVNSKLPLSFPQSRCCLHPGLLL